jgi:hypothetical protein
MSESLGKKLEIFAEEKHLCQLQKWTRNDL